VTKHVEDEGRSAGVESLRCVLKGQYHGALAMLRQGIEQCPEALWFRARPADAVWQIAYHTLYFAHLYLQPSGADFRPWEGHQADVQNPDGIAGPPHPESPLPVIPEPYTREQVLSYWRFCDGMVDDALERLDLLSPESGFHWY